MIFLESWSKFLLFFHFLAAIMATATAWHLLVRFLIKVRGRRGLLRLVRLHALLLLISYGITFVLGGLIYPAFRVRVRVRVRGGGMAAVRGKCGCHSGAAYALDLGETLCALTAM